MRIIISGRNIELTKAIKDHITDKLNRLDHHFDFIHEIHVFVSVDKNPSIRNRQRADATVHVNGAVVRVGECSENLYTSIDLMVEKVDRSLNKHKTKLLHRAKSSKGANAGPNGSIRRVGLEEFESFEEGPHEEGAEHELYLTYSDEFEEIEIPAPTQK